MASRKSLDITLPEDARKRAIAGLRAYFAENMDDEIGDLKAGMLLDHFVSELGPTIYNQAIADARQFLDEQLADMSSVLYREELPTAGRRR